MRFLTAGVLLSLMLVPFGVCGDKPKDVPFKLDGSYFEKTWGIKVISVKESGATGNSARTLTVLLEHEKDLQGEDLKLASAAFDNKIFPQKNPAFQALFFDQDNVVILKAPIGSMDGEATGIKGDAFRLIYGVTSQTLEKTKKLAFRPIEKGSSEKDKNKN